MDTVKTVLRRRGRIAAALSSVMEQCDTVTGFEVARAADLVVHLLPDNCQYGAIYRSLSQLIGPRCPKQVLEKFAWSLAANVPSLRLGEVVTPERVHREDRVLVQVSAAKRRVSRYKDQEPSAVFRGKILVGPGTPADVHWNWSMKFVRYLACRPDGLGFDRPRQPKGAPYRDFAALVGMRMYADIKVADGKIKIETVRCSPGLREHNRELVVMRERRSGFRCPFGFKRHCHACPKGRNSCPAAVRPLDLTTAKCAVCGRDFTADPTWNEQRCNECERKKR